MTTPTTAAGRVLLDMVWQNPDYPAGGGSTRWHEAVAAVEAEAVAAVLAMMGDHHPKICSWIDDSTWLECSCGWDSSKEGAVDWHQHLIAAVSAVTAA